MWLGRAWSLQTACIPIPRNLSYALAAATPAAPKACGQEGWKAEQGEEKACVGRKAYKLCKMYCLMPGHDSTEHCERFNSPPTLEGRAGKIWRNCHAWHVYTKYWIEVEWYMYIPIISCCLTRYSHRYTTRNYSVHLLLHVNMLCMKIHVHSTLAKLVVEVYRKPRPKCTTPGRVQTQYTKWMEHLRTILNKCT